MATKLTCDFCEIEITPECERSMVTIFENAKDKTVLVKDACGDCTRLVQRLLGKNRDRLLRAIEAASDRQ